jgi:hypothetical protein
MVLLLPSTAVAAGVAGARKNPILPLLTKTRTSTLFAVAVIVGAVPPGHRTPVNVAVLVPPCVRISVIEAPAVAVGMVKVQLPLSVTVCTEPVVKASVVEVPLLPTVCVCSRTTGRRAAATVPLVMSAPEWTCAVGVLASVSRESLDATASVMP